jgi:hypothetical protein
MTEVTFSFLKDTLLVEVEWVCEIWLSIAVGMSQLATEW